jgi:hypothetical protein
MRHSFVGNELTDTTTHCVARFDCLVMRTSLADSELVASGRLGQVALSRQRFACGRVL